MLFMDKIIYVLGAGASYNSLPIVAKSENRNSFGQYFIDTFNYLDSIIKSLEQNENINDGLTRSLRSLHEQAKEIINIPEEYGTPDTYARTLKFKRDSDKLLDKYKKFFSIFFILFQIYKVNKKLKGFIPIDKRYLTWLSYIINDDSGEAQINEKVCIISWNYDNEIEKTIENYFTSYPSNNSKTNINDKLIIFIRNKYKIFSEFSQYYEPLRYDFEKNKGNPSVIKLNGSYSTFKLYTERGAQFEDIELLYQKNCLDFTEIMKQLNEKILPNLDSNRLETELGFGWESNNTYIDDIALSQMKLGKVLVIIGYSFPAYNRNLDKKLINNFMENVSESNIKTIHIQAEIASAKSIEQKLRGLIDSSKINLIDFQIQSDLSQFYIPIEL